MSNAKAQAWTRTPDRSNPIIRMTRKGCAIWLDDPKANPALIENLWRPLTEWAAKLYLTAPELRRWVRDGSGVWEVKT